MLPFPSEDLEISAEAVTRLAGARIFVTGGTGFFGKWLLSSLCHAADTRGAAATAVVLTRNPEAFRAEAPHLASHRSIRLHAGDVRTFAAPDGAFTHAVHAATASAHPVSPAETVETVVDGTRRVLAFAKDRGVARLLFASSGAVYGRQPPELTHVPEEHAGAPDPLDPKSAYGESKRLAEQLCAQATAAVGPACVIARGFAFVGPGLPGDVHFAIGNFLRDAIAGGPVVVKGDGTPFRSYLHGGDLAAWLWTMLATGTPGRAYNTGSEDAVSIGDLATLTAKTLGVPVRIEGTPQAGKPAERYVPSTARARSELGLSQKIDLVSALRRTADWIALCRHRKTT